MSSETDYELYVAAVGRKAGELLALRGGPNLAAPLLVFLVIVLVTFLRPTGMLQ